MSLFALGLIDPLLVDRFSGFDLPRTAQVVGLLSDGGSGPDDVLQASGTRSRQATVTGTVTDEADVILMRGYDVSKEELTFYDGRGAVTLVRVLELSVEDDTDRWGFTITLLATSDTAPPGS